MSQKLPVSINATLAKNLITEQFPQWAALPITSVAISGHDNRTFHLGDEMSIRLASAKWYAAHVKTEQRWLPKLATQLPLPIATPIAMGEPGQGYPWYWLVNNWLAGENAAPESIGDLKQFAIDLADFLNVLRSIDATDAPPPNQANFFRGGDLSIYSSQTKQCIDQLQDIIDAKAAQELWQVALDSNWSKPAVWLHGDIAVGNLLVTCGNLSAVIDFGQLAAGDPACDLTIAWTLFSGASRRTFHQQVNLDNNTWSRSRGWAMWKALLQLQQHRGSNEIEAAKALKVIDEVLSDCC